MQFTEASSILNEIKRLKADGNKIVFTNGVFDILHIGHVRYLQAAKALGSILIVGINDDASVKRLNKGPERPIHDEQARAGVVDALQCVDFTIIFSEDTPAALIEILQPDILVKGGDYDAKETNPHSKRYIVGSSETITRGGEVVCIPTVEGYSTTAAIKKIQSSKD
jgi:D-beta-D-heptose 7-phosphate kinase/D-beta-D-heptose 1-phosphate adenosyltransferase